MMKAYQEGWWIVMGRGVIRMNEGRRGQVEGIFGGVNVRKWEGENV